MEIIQETAALADHHEQAAAGTMVFLIVLEVLGQVIDALGQQRNLHIGRTGIPLVQLEILNRFRFRFHTVSSIQQQFLN